MGRRAEIRPKRVLIGLSMVIGAAVLVGGVVLGANLVRPHVESEPITLLRPGAGQARADYLPDGTPVWVIGHEDGSASVLSGFDTHTPGNIGKLLWWCRPAHGLENPHHGSHWDEYGTRLGGPAPSGLPSWETGTQGNRLVLGTQRPPQPSAVPEGPPEFEREWCAGHDVGVVFHTFNGWKRWESPQAAIAAAPVGWILLEGSLEVDRATGSAVLCALDGCADAAMAAGVSIPEPGMEFGPEGPDRFIAQVRDGALAKLTRVVWLNQE